MDNLDNKLFPRNPFFSAKIKLVLSCWKNTEVEPSGVCTFEYSQMKCDSWFPKFNLKGWFKTFKPNI